VLVINVEVVGFINSFVCIDVVVEGGKVVVTWMELPLTGSLALALGIYRYRVFSPGPVW
jgi:hypothetical protein